MTKKINYPFCLKGGQHSNELLNKCCIQSTCVNNQLCCIVCVDNEHHNHKLKTINELISSAKANIKLIKPANKDLLIGDIVNHKKQFIKMFNTHRKQIYSLLDTYEEHILDYYDRFISSIGTKVITSQKQIKQIDQSVYKIKSVKQFQSLATRISKFYPYQKQRTGNISTSLLIQKVNSFISLTEEKIKKSNQHVQSFMEKKQNVFSKQNTYGTIQIRQDVTQNQLFQINSEKSKINPQKDKSVPSTPTQKKTDKSQPIQSNKQIDNPQALKINIISFKAEKSLSESMAIATMAPIINPDGATTNITFIIRQMIGGGFIGFGLCDLKKAKQNKFRFQNYDRGMYMMSSIGKTWPLIPVPDQHNILKPFKIQKYDVIQMQIRDSDQKIRFIKKKIIKLKDNPYHYWAQTSQAFELAYQRVNQQQLVPFLAFYNINAQVAHVIIQQQQINYPVIKKNQSTIPQDKKK